MDRPNILIIITDQQKATAWHKTGMEMKYEF
jgi:hypothetical protein